MKTILRIDASARYNASYSRQLGDRLLTQLKAKYPEMTVIYRDLAKGVIYDVEVIAGDRLVSGAEERMAQAQQQIDQLISQI